MFNTLKFSRKYISSYAYSKSCLRTSIIEKQYSRVADFIKKSDYNSKCFFFPFINIEHSQE